MTREEFSLRITELQHTMYHVACGILRGEADREDAVQEAICKAWQKQDTLKDPAAFRAWLLRILINECYDICRRGGRLVFVEELPEEAAPERDDHGLREALTALDPRFRLPITLFYIEGFSVRETAQLLRLPEGTVKSRLHAGRAKLKAALSEEVEV